MPCTQVHLFMAENVEPDGQSRPPVEATALASHVSQWAAEAELDNPMQAGNQVGALAVVMTQALIAGQPGTCTVEDIARALSAVAVPVG